MAWQQIALVIALGWCVLGLVLGLVLGPPLRRNRLAHPEPVGAGGSVRGHPRRSDPGQVVPARCPRDRGVAQRDIAAAPLGPLTTSRWMVAPGAGTGCTGSTHRRG